MFDAFSRWKRKFSTSASESQTALVPSQQNDTESHRGSAGTGRGSRQFLSISQPIPRSSPSSLSGSIVRSGSGGAGEGSSITYATGGIGNTNTGWEDQVLSGIEDNKPMGSLGRRRMGSVSSGSSSHGHAVGGGEGDEPYLQGTHASSGLSAPEVVRMDSVPPRYHSFEQQQQQFHYPTSRGNLRLQTNVQPQHASYSTHHYNQPFMHHYSHPPQHQQQQHRQPHSIQPPHQIKQLSPIAEASPTSTSADYQSLKKAGSEILAGSSSSPSPGGTSNNVRNSVATGSRRRSGSIGSGPSIHISAGSESQSGGTTSASAGTGVSVVGSSRRHSGVSGTVLTGSSAGTGSGNGMLGVGGGNGGGLSPGTPRTATTFHGDAGSPMSQYETPTTSSASPDGPGFSPNIVVSSPISAGGPQGAGVGNAPVNTTGGARSGTPDVPRPSPVYSSPFISRTLNRTASQTSSRGRSNSTGTVPGPIMTGANVIANMSSGQAASPVVAVNLGRQGSLRSVATSATRQEQQQQQQPQQQSFSHSGTLTLVGSLSGGGGGGGGTQSQNPLSSSTTVVSSSPRTDPPVIPPLNLSPPFPGPHPYAGPRAIKGRGKSRIVSGGSWSSWGSRGKRVGVGMMPKIPGSHEGYDDEYDDDEEYDEGEGSYVNEDGYYDEEEGYEEGVSAPGEEASGGYGYGYGYGYGLAEEAGYAGQEEEQERMSYREKDTVRYADQVKRDYVEDEMEAGPSGIRIHVEEYVDPQEQGHSRQVNDSAHGDKLRLRPGGLRVQKPRIPSSESFITRRWSRDRQRGIPTDSNGMRHSLTNFFHLRAKNQRRLLGLANFTPAFWAFWLGFICPVLWLVGGWHFTSFGEQPPRVGVWEYYFSGRSPGGGLGWKEVICCCVPGGRKRFIDIESGGGAGIGGDVKDKGKGKEVGRSEKPERTVPMWISEKQRVNDPNHLKRSLRGISFGYPFIPRPAVDRGEQARARPRVLRTVGKPNRLLDQLYGVKLREVRGKPESGRRMFDPWIQRCRYAFCYACALMAIGLCTASMYLIVFNTRQLR